MASDACHGLSSDVFGWLESQAFLVKYMIYAKRNWGLYGEVGDYMLRLGILYMVKLGILQDWAGEMGDSLLDLEWFTTCHSPIN